MARRESNPDGITQVDDALPASTRRLVKQVQPRDRNPSLYLDKHLEPTPEQKDQKTVLEEFLKTSVDPALFKALQARRSAALNALGAISWERKTSTPMTLHLSRTGALENAGICLHPLYGFSYLPGSGLKGLAYAYAKVAARAAETDLRAIFGAAARHKGEEVESGLAGSIVFHDAWPLEQVVLQLDIANNHHRRYYENEDAPGDWESPMPISFLAIPRGTRFSLSISKRHPGVPDSHLHQARAWLDAGLSCLGFGAKTAAGYGRFAPVGPFPSFAPGFETFLAQVTLQSPAFLAGANQAQEDCDLRSATVRGLLRWWWRTLHAGYLNRRELLALESAIWGDTNEEAALQIAVAPAEESRRNVYDKKKIMNANQLPTPPSLFYLSYGMDDAKRKRWYIEPGASWHIRLVARDSKFAVHRKSLTDPKKRLDAPTIPKQVVLEQGRAALSLLCRFGGVGSKGRKGFGSLSLSPGEQAFTLDKCRKAADQLRRALGLPTQFVAARAESSSLENALDPLEKDLSESNVWRVIDQVGSAYQAFAKVHKHNEKKLALGLPRLISRRKVSGPKGDRHASPVHIHVERTAKGHTVRMIVFPSPMLPSLKASRDFLAEFRAHMDRALSDPLSQPIQAKTVPAVAARGSAAPQAATKPVGKGQERGGLLRRKGDAWVVILDGDSREAVLLNPEKLPPGLKDSARAVFHVIEASAKGVKVRYLRP